MQPTAKFKVVGVYADGKTVVIAKPETREGAEIVVRLIKPASPFKELRIEDGHEEYFRTLPTNEMGQPTSQIEQ